MIEIWSSQLLPIQVLSIAVVSIRSSTMIRYELLAQRPIPPTLLMLPRNTTRTAQYLPKKSAQMLRSTFCRTICSPASGVESSAYPAEAATISCLLAFVNAERAAENTRVKTMTTAMVSGLVAMVPWTENL